jgi:hypothetical protein
MAYHPEFPYEDLSDLVSGVVMIIAATFTIWKISKGSKNVFAYVLMSFTLLLGIAYLGLAFCDVFRYEVQLTDGVYYFRSIYVHASSY